MKARVIWFAACSALLLGMAVGGYRGMSGGAAVAQNLGVRTVSGAVLGADSQPVVGATVYLESQKTKSIRSFTTVAKGHYQFAQVKKTEDFDLWAEKDGKKSPVKTVSSWDARTEFIADLKLK